MHLHFTCTSITKYTSQCHAFLQVQVITASTQCVSWNSNLMNLTPQFCHFTISFSIRALAHFLIVWVTSPSALVYSVQGYGWDYSVIKQFEKPKNTNYTDWPTLQHKCHAHLIVCPPQQVIIIVELYKRQKSNHGIFYRSPTTNLPCP